MRCPICGSKMVQGELCKYCNITSDQVNNASNKKVSEYRRNDMTDLIYFTTEIPNDVSRIKLLLFTIFLGLFGVNHYYVKRNIRGLYSTLSTALCIIFLVLNLAVPTLSSVLVFRLMYEIIFFAMAINVLLWVCDIINLIFKHFKIPVVLADKGDKK